MTDAGQRPNPPHPPGATRFLWLGGRLGLRFAAWIGPIPWRPVLWGTWAAAGLLWLGISFQVGRTPEHWPQNPVGSWSGETNGHAPMWPLYRRLGWGAHPEDQGSNGVYRISRHALAELGRFMSEGNVWTWSSWVHLATPTNDPAMELEIRDNGRGFDPLTANGDGMGMLTLRERAVELGGTIEVRSSPGDGTVVRVEFDPVRTGNRA